MSTLNNKFQDSWIRKHYIISICTLLFVLMLSNTGGSDAVIGFFILLGIVFGLFALLKYIARILKVKGLNTQKLGSYEDRLDQVFSEGFFDAQSDGNNLVCYAEELGLDSLQINKAHKRFCSRVFSNIIKDGQITTDELTFLNRFMQYSNIESKDFNFDQKKFNKFLTLGNINEGILRPIDVPGLNVMLNSGECFHWACPAILLKMKKVTERINYGGFTGSVKIMKGVRYRYGSIKAQTISKDVLNTEDDGRFWMSNKRIGFKGNKQHFNLAYNKLLSFELSGKGLLIFKDGKELPYMLGLDDYEVPSAIVSYMLNNNK